MKLTIPSYTFAPLILLSLACTDSPAPTAEAPTASNPAAPTSAEPSPLTAWWDHLAALCGHAYAGKLVSDDATDAELAEQPMTMHVRHCDKNRLEIPFQIGENRSRTWVLTRSDEGVRLQHRHLHEDGTEDDVSFYGGLSDDSGTAVAQFFPADAYSKQLFTNNDLTASTVNIWSMEIVPGQRFSYILRRPERHFQADFDLSSRVEEPPAPWGPHRPTRYVFAKPPTAELNAYVFPPEGRDSQHRAPAIVIFHGGGWEIGEPSWGFSRARDFASKGMVAVSAQYRLIDGETITPLESMLDARTVIRWMRDNADDLGIAPDQIAAYGWSAGAHLAASAAIFNADDAEHHSSSVPNALALFSPALSLMGYERFHLNLLGRAETLDVSPAEHVRAGLPPSVIVIGRTDTVTPLANAQLFHDNMLEHGNVSHLHVYDGVGHLFTPSDQPDDGWPNPDREVRQQAYDAIDSFLESLGYFEPSS